MQDMQAKFGTLFEQAEAMQKNAQEQQALAAQLLASAHERIQQLQALNAQLAERIAAFNGLPKKLGVLAYKGGEAAIAAEVMKSLDNAVGIIGAATREITEPVKSAMNASLEAVNGARTNLLSTQHYFSWRALTGAGVFAFICVLAVLFASWTGVEWQRRTIAADKENSLVELNQLKESIASFTKQNDELKKFNAEMEKKAEELDAKGVRFMTTQCSDEKAKKKMRLCIETDPSDPFYDNKDKTRKYAIPKGF